MNFVTEVTLSGVCQVARFGINKGLSAVVNNRNNTLLVMQFKYVSFTTCSFCVKEDCIGMLKA